MDIIVVIRAKCTIILKKIYSIFNCTIFYTFFKIKKSCAYNYRNFQFYKFVIIARLIISLDLVELNLATCFVNSFCVFMGLFCSFT